MTPLNIAIACAGPAGLAAAACLARDGHNIRIFERFETPRPIEELRPEVPKWVAAILQRLLAKRPEERFQTPLELAEALGIYYREIGVETEIEVLDWAKVREMFRKKAIGCCIWPNIISWRPSEEWIRTSYWSKSPNHHYENEFVDKHYEMLTNAVNPKER